MNKLKVTIAGMLIACLSIGAMNAQDKSATSPAPKTSKKAPATKATPGAKTQTGPGGQHLKKDGTPDMRYKENKAAAKPGSSTPSTKKGTEMAHPKKAAPKKAASENNAK